MAALTHRGRFLFCPVYIGDLDSDNPLVVPRRWVPDFVLTLALHVFYAWSTFAGDLWSDYEPAFPFVITGTIECRT